LLLLLHLLTGVVDRVDGGARRPIAFLLAPRPPIEELLLLSQVDPIGPLPNHNPFIVGALLLGVLSFAGLAGGDLWGESDLVVVFTLGDTFFVVVFFGSSEAVLVLGLVLGVVEVLLLDVLLPQLEAGRPTHDFPIALDHLILEHGCPQQVLLIVQLLIDVAPQPHPVLALRDQLLLLVLVSVQHPLLTQQRRIHQIRMVVGVPEVLLHGALVHGELLAVVLLRVHLVEHPWRCQVLPVHRHLRVDVGDHGLRVRLIPVVLVPTRVLKQYRHLVPQVRNSRKQPILDILLVDMSKVLS